MNVLTTYLVGIVVAVASSVPVGPINFAIIQTVFTRGKGAAMSIGVGGMIADTLYCFLALMLYGLIVKENSPAIFTWLNLITIPVVILLGYFMIKKRNQRPEHRKKFRAGNGILLGVSLGISNPVLFAYWLWVASFIQANGWMDESMPQYIGFTVGVASGVCAFFLGFVNLIALSTRRITDTFRSTFSLLVGSGFILFGVYLAARFVWLHV